VLDRKKFIMTFWDKLKIIIGIMCLPLIFVQLAAASKMITENKTEVKMISPEQYNDLQFGAEVAAEIKADDIILNFDGKSEEMDYYLVRVNDDHAVIMRTLLNSATDGAMYALLNGTRESVTYKGRVNTIPEADLSVVNLTVLSGDLLYKKGMSRHLDEVILRYSIDIALYETQSSDKYIIATIVGALIMLAAAVWAFWKPFQKIGRGFAAQMGKIDLDLIKKEDLPVEQGWFTEESSKKDYIENLPERKIDENFEKVDFYESGINQEGNFYVEKKNSPVKAKSEDDDSEGFVHKHMNY